MQATSEQEHPSALHTNITSTIIRLNRLISHPQIVVLPSEARQDSERQVLQHVLPVQLLQQHRYGLPKQSGRSLNIEPCAVLGLILHDQRHGQNVWLCKPDKIRGRFKVVTKKGST